MLCSLSEQDLKLEIQRSYQMRSKHRKTSHQAELKPVTCVSDYVCCRTDYFLESLIYFPLNSSHGSLFISILTLARSYISRLEDAVLTR